MHDYEPESGGIRGQILRTESGKPIGAVPVNFVFGTGPFLDIVLECDDQGSFTLEPVAAGHWLLSVHTDFGDAGEAAVDVLPGEMTEVIVWTQSSSDNVDLATTSPRDDMSSSDDMSPNERSLITEEVEGDPPDASGDASYHDDVRTLGTMQGRVVSAEAGDGIPDATVLVVDGPASTPDIAPVTDERGRFEIDGLSPGIWRLRAISPGGHIGEVVVYLPPSPTIDIVISEQAE